MRDDPQALAASIETVFRRVEETAMAGVPLLNKAVRVEVAGIRPAGSDWLACLVTPWFMNLMLLPREAAPSSDPAGVKSIVALPGGGFEFIQAWDETLGPYRLCSVFSPMFDFADHETALATAREILDLVCAEAEADEEDRDMVAIWQGRLPEPAPPEHEPEPHAPSPAPSPALSRRRLFGLPVQEEPAP